MAGHTVNVEGQFVRWYAMSDKQTTRQFSFGRGVAWLNGYARHGQVLDQYDPLQPQLSVCSIPP